MLRRPSKWPVVQREEGCSSTAFGQYRPGVPAAWNNLTNCGTAGTPGRYCPAVP